MTRMASLSIMVNSEEVSKTHLLCLQVTLEQEVAIYAFFQFNNWKILREVIPDKCDVCSSKISRSDEIDQTQLDGLFSGQLASNTESQPVVIQILDQQQQQQTNSDNIEIHDVVTNNLLEPISSELDEEENNVYNSINGTNATNKDNSLILNNSELNNFEGENNIQVQTVPTVEFNYSQENLSTDVSETNDDIEKYKSIHLEKHNSEVPLNTKELSDQIDELLVKNKDINEDQESITEDINHGEGIEDISCPVEKSVALEKTFKTDTQLKEIINKTSVVNSKVVSAGTQVVRRSSRKRKENSNNDIVRDVYPFSCMKCDKGFMEEKYFKSHLKAYHGDKCVICDKCGKSFPNNYLLKKHERFHDETVEKYHCKKCDKTFVDENLLKKHEHSHLNRHMNRHTKEKSYNCDECDRSFLYLTALQNHKARHKQGWKCKLCQEIFLIRKSFWSHGVQ
ncbi:hypothetical protein KUTeg_023803 [Tegillarca granosa]|uniref:C2H2-type domain-containing protein n=1 Tax=Tegillarca granosa TaxID=220873 RepID=A0ABQ9E8V1_TEGGR|nr:hypothetical protein KUTeg_023803 [Tegillarca granosa]